MLRLLLCVLGLIRGRRMAGWLRSGVGLPLPRLLCVGTVHDAVALEAERLRLGGVVVVLSDETRIQHFLELGEFRERVIGCRR